MSNYKIFTVSSLDKLLQDLRALKLLEKFIGRDDVLSLLEKEGVLSYSKYTTDAKWFLGFRQKINKLINRHMV